MASIDKTKDKANAVAPGEATATDAQAAAPAAAQAFKPKKSVALSGVVAGNTALCTVGKTGNDLQMQIEMVSRRQNDRIG